MVGASYERELRDILRKDGWVVFRSAGSFVCDLIALKPDDHRLIEVKATKFDKFYTSNFPKLKEQFDLLNEYAKQGFNVYYYIRWKGERKSKWNLYQLPLKPYPVFKKLDDCQKLLKKQKVL